MSVFVDTSAVLGLLDESDPRHDAVVAAWESLAGSGRFVTSNYVVVESFAVAPRRLGMRAARTAHDAIFPLIEMVFLSPEEHEVATAAFLAAGRRRVSFVDCTSFELMRRRGIASALALDADFAEQGFELLPRPIA